MENYEKENIEKRELILSKMKELTDLCDGERYHIAVIIGEKMFEKETGGQSCIQISCGVNASSHTIITMLSDLIISNQKIKRVYTEICKTVLLDKITNNVGCS